MEKTGMLNTAFTAAEYGLVISSAKADCMSLSEALRMAVKLACESASCSGYADVIAALDDVGGSLNDAARIANRMARSATRRRALEEADAMMLHHDAKALADAAASVRLRVGLVVTVADAARDCVTARLSDSSNLTLRASVRLSGPERAAFVAAARASGMSAARLLRAVAVALAGDGHGSRMDVLRVWFGGRKILVVGPTDRSRLRHAVSRWQVNSDQVGAACDVVAKASAAAASRAGSFAEALVSLLGQARADCAWSADRVSSACTPLWWD